jgi:hypothetical protein
LIVLAADKDARFALTGILSQPSRLGIRAVDFVIDQHPQHDAGCRVYGVDYLRGAVRQFQHALLLFDHRGCGREDLPSEELALQLENQLELSGWEKRAKVIVIDPELDVWIWSDSPHVAEALGWKTEEHEFRKWLERNGLIGEGQIKPKDPKEALRRALRQANKPRSSAIYGEIAGKVSLSRCEDRAFTALRNALQCWFGFGTSSGT